MQTNVNELYPTKHLNASQREIRELAFDNFEAFIRLVAPFQLLAHCHISLCKWIRKFNHENKLLLWPRDHGKSRMAAFYTCWEIIRDPATTIIYASATAEKAEEQLRFIKNILDSKIVKRYFPNLLKDDEGRREAWNKTFIIIDHPYRKQQGVIDATLMTCGLEKTITGKHCKRLILDDIVVPENNSEIGRRDVNGWAAQAASIMSSDSSMLVVGTRYHPRDAYQIMMDMEAHIPIKDENGETTTESEHMFVVNMANVETDGEFLWPRTQRKDGQWFGFNDRILARKRAVYEANNEIVQFYAQYYNDPNDKSAAPISRELFNYYEKDALEQSLGAWTIDGRICYTYAAVDLATSKSGSADYTVITVGAIDTIGNRYVLAIDRYKTDKISVTQEKLREHFIKYKYKKLRIEAVAGFKLVAQDLADNLIDAGIRVPVDLYTPSPNEAKAARINNILEPLYQAQAVYHYRGGNCQILEDELVSVNPLNDDTKDSWAMCVDLMTIPIVRRQAQNKRRVFFHPRFGGVAA